MVKMDETVLMECQEKVLVRTTHFSPTNKMTMHVVLFSYRGAYWAAGSNRS